MRAHVPNPVARRAKVEKQIRDQQTSLTNARKDLGEAQKALSQGAPTKT